MRVLFLIILSLMISNASWAYLTAGKIAVTATSSSSGVPSASQDSDITDTKGSSVSVGVPVAVTGNVNITGNYQVNGTPISATSNWNQSGSTINYTAGNVGIGSANPGQTLDVVGTVRTTNLNIHLYAYGSSLTTSSNPGAPIKIAYGSTTSGATSAQITNLPFTSSTSYSCTCVVTSGQFNDMCNTANNSASAMTLYSGGSASHIYSWQCIGS